MPRQPPPGVGLHLLGEAEFGVVHDEAVKTDSLLRKVFHRSYGLYADAISRVAVETPSSLLILNRNSVRIASVCEHTRLAAQVQVSSPACRVHRGTS